MVVSDVVRGAALVQVQLWLASMAGWQGLETANLLSHV
jgi:hypothetical protein